MSVNLRPGKKKIPEYAESHKHSEEKNICSTVIGRSGINVTVDLISPT